jgi:WD40 repeat protein
MFSITEVREGLTRGRLDASATDAPYTGCWATVAPQQGETVLEGHQGEILAVREVPGDGTSMLASMDESDVRIWDPASGDLINSFSPPGARLTTACVVPTPGAPLLVTAQADGSICLWDPATSRRLRALNGHTDAVRYLCVVRSGGRELLVSAGEDRTVRVWDPLAGLQLRQLTDYTGPLVALSGPDHEGEILLVDCQDRSAQRWQVDPERAEPVHRYARMRTPTTAIEAFFDQERGQIAVGRGSWLEYWDAPSGSLDRMRRKSGQIVALCGIRAGDREQLIATADQRGSLLIWDAYAADPIGLLLGHLAPARSLCSVQVNGRTMLASGSADRTVRIWSLTKLPHTNQDTERIAAKTLCAVDIHGSTVIAHASAGAALHFNSALDGRPLPVRYQGPPGVMMLCRSELNGRAALAGCTQRSNSVWLWDPESDRPARLLMGHQHQVGRLCPLRLGELELVAVGYADGTVRIWHPQTNRTLHVLKQQPAEVSALCLVDGAETLVAAGMATGAVQLWRVADGAPRPPLNGHRAAVGSLVALKAEDEDALLLASGSADHSVRLWDPYAGVEVRRLHGHDAPITALQPVRLAGRSLLASASTDRTVRIWDPLDARCLAEIPVYSPAHALAIAEGNLVVGLTDGLLALRLNPALLGGGRRIRP